MGWVVTAMSGCFTPRKKLVPMCTGGWVGPRAALDGCGKLCPRGDSFPRPSSLYRFAISTTLSWSTMKYGANITLKPTKNK